MTSSKIGKYSRDPQVRLDAVLAADPENADLKLILWSRELKATPARMAVLRALSNEPTPLSIDALGARLKRETQSAACDTATLYRMLETFLAKGLVTKTSLGADEASYELATGRPHHHHAVCTLCGEVEDVHTCEGEELNILARHGLKKFGRIRSHSLEFFGLCKKCDAAAA